MSKSKVHD